MIKHLLVRQLFVGTESFHVVLWKAVVLALLVVPRVSAAELRGVVLNGTTGKPAGADEVVVLDLSTEGMAEKARTRTGKEGRFSVLLDDEQASHLVRVIHQGVTYHQMAETSRPMSIKVFDLAPQLIGVSAIMDVERFEATTDRLEIKQLVTMRNQSNPPRTLVNDRTFEVQLPPEAKVQYGLIQVEEGQPLKQRPIPGHEPGQYYFSFPLRPGDTRFAVIYDIPYRGRATITPVIRNVNERFVVMLPKSMNFEPRDATIFQAMPGTTADNVHGTGAVLPGQRVEFEISGTGTLAELEGRREQVKQSTAPAKPRPGGGLGAPTGAADPLEKYRWHILGGFATLLVAGGLFVIRKSTPRTIEAVQPIPPAGLARSSQVHSRRTTKARHPRKSRVPQQAVRY